MLTVEYEDRVDETLLLRLFSPGRLREGTVGTDWTVAVPHRSEGAAHYHAVPET